MRLAVLLVGLVLITAEVFFRLEPKFRRINSGTSAAPSLRFLSIPTEFTAYTDGYNVKSLRSENLNTNGLGFRTTREIGEKAPDEKRVFVLGGSAAAGWGATSDETTFPIKLEKKLQKSRFRHTYVFNAGCDGFNSNQEWVLMATRIMDLKPDLIVLFDGYNDLHFSMTEAWFPDYNIFSPQVRNMVSFHEWYKHSALLNFLDAKTKLIRTRSKFVGHPAHMRPEYLDVYLKNLKKISWAAKISGARTLSVLQPHFMIAKRPLTPSEENVFKIGHDVNTLNDYRKFVPKLYDNAQLRLPLESTKGEWAFADGNEWFRGVSEQLFIDEVHLTDQGHTIIADKLYAFILKNHLLDKRQD